MAAEAALAAASVASAWWVQVIGYTGQACYFSRVAIQWLASERAKRPVAPRIFWYFSAAGAVLISVYSVLREEYVFLPGCLITLGIYLRNLWIASREPRAGRAAPLSFVLAALAIAVGAFTFGLLRDPVRAAPSAPWLAVAIVGQVFWIGRFLVQWRHAERHGKSEFPPAFWWMTIVGGSLNAVYSMHRVDLPFIFGFVFSGLAPARNLMLHHRHQKAAS